MFLIYNQIRDARIWNKLHFTYTFFPNNHELEDLEIFLDDRVAFWKRNAPLKNNEVLALLGQDSLNEQELLDLSKAFTGTAQSKNVKDELCEAGRKLKFYMNQIEEYCAAIQAGIIDSESAKQIYGYKFKRSFEKALPWIVQLKSIKNEGSLYIEIVKVLNDWFPAPKGQNNIYKT